MTATPKKRQDVRKAKVTGRTKTNIKRSRYLKKTDEEILFEILVRAERIGSFCPEELMRIGQIAVFEEAYRRFETWDMIVEKCVTFSNEQDLIGRRLMPPKEIVLEILRMEGRGESLWKFNVVANHRELYDATLMFYGSWDRILVIVGIKQHECICDPPS